MVELRRADLWRGGDGRESGEACALWSVSGHRCCAVCERAARWEAVRRLCGAILRLAGAFRDSTIDAEQAAGRTLRDFAALVPAGGRVWNLARRSADHDAKF